MTVAIVIVVMTHYADARGPAVLYRGHPFRQRRISVRFLFNIMFALTIAAVVGLGLTYVAVEHGRLFGAIRSGEWSAWPRAGRFDSDPYTRAKLTRSREIPLGAGEGLAFIAVTDTNRQPLNAGCDYRVVGRTPTARLWTLTVYRENGQLMQTALGRHGFSSRDVLRRPDGSFEIILSPQARPGNWLQTESSGKMKLSLRIYDTPLTTGTEFTATGLPRIIQERCP